MLEPKLLLLSFAARGGGAGAIAIKNCDLASTGIAVVVLAAQHGGHTFAGVCYLLSEGSLALATQSSRNGAAKASIQQICADA